MLNGLDPSANNNEAICNIADNTPHKTIEALNHLLKDQRVNPSGYCNYPIRLASQRGNILMVQRLLEDSRVDPSTDDNYLIRYSSSEGHLGVVDLLLKDPRVNSSANNNFAIIHASTAGHLLVVERLLQDHRVDPSAEDNYAIRHATQIGKLAIVKRLLQDPRCASDYPNGRVDPSEDNNFAIRSVALQGYVDSVSERIDQLRGSTCVNLYELFNRLLEDTRVDPSVGENVCICYACESGNESIVRRLLQDHCVDSTVDNY